MWLETAVMSERENSNLASFCESDVSSTSAGETSMDLVGITASNLPSSALETRDPFADQLGASQTASNHGQPDFDQASSGQTESSRDGEDVEDSVCIGGSTVCERDTTVGVGDTTIGGENNGNVRDVAEEDDEEDEFNVIIGNEGSKSVETVRWVFSLPELRSFEAHTRSIVGSYLYVRHWYLWR